MPLIRIAATISALLAAGPAWAHGGRLVGPNDVWSAWTFDPLVIVPLLLGHWLYGRGLARLWGRAGRGRGVARWQAACFLSGELALVLALVWPLDALGETLFSAHMMQHMLLSVVAPPLLILGAPLAPMAAALPSAWRPAILSIHRFRLWGFLSRPAVAFALHGAGLWIWHAPAFFDAAIENETLHKAEHLSFILSSVFFWWAVIHAGRRGIPGLITAGFWTFSTLMHTGLLGALITFAPRPLYYHYVTMPVVWPMTPLEDQQLAGLIMWVPAGAAYLAAGLLLALACLRRAAAGSSDLSEAPKQPAARMG